ncbi:hypothetical protein BMW24_018285 [Mycobacterium heckeshornense]|uniref:Uncharacterized protein n=1 Tax=Mycobacterium heckeshornense TaxID=110505 RepID=A0A2G8B4D6_9MYCO|nr:hypothetical protein [Mycobacterium heckeshornense]MCV7034194.1 hypothetical protein [Mycobacterium heckeshornense]PIJ32600.1 hypothetical protein BMW24_018285 [Mycobacterium heckeshornense]BCO36849.1 hypothetical protein MHEC_32820 [Mycobacterium heckeshornense]
MIEIVIDGEVRRRAGSTALELLEMARCANATGVIDADTVTLNKEPVYTLLGVVFLMEVACTALGGNDFHRGLILVRELLKSVIARISDDA